MLQPVTPLSGRVADPVQNFVLLYPDPVTPNIWWWLKILCVLGEDDRKFVLFSLIRSYFFLSFFKSYFNLQVCNVFWASIKYVKSTMPKKRQKYHKSQPIFYINVHFVEKNCLRWRWFEIFLRKMFIFQSQDPSFGSQTPFFRSVESGYGNQKSIRQPQIRKKKKT